MNYWNYGRIKAKITRDMTLQNQKFVSNEELLDYTNEGIANAESHIHKFGRDDDYFLTNTIVNFQPDVALYPFPDSIYANKIRGFYLRRGDQKYEIKRIKNRMKFSVRQDNITSPYYQFFIYNDQINIIPTPKETIEATLWYTKKANILVNDEDICNIPEFIHYILFYVKYMIALKEESYKKDDFKELMIFWRDRMINTLSEQTDEDENDIYEDVNLHIDQATIGTHYPIFSTRA